MSDPEAAAKTLVTMIGLPKPLIACWVNRVPKKKPVICLSINPKTPRATRTQSLAKIPAEIHGIKIKMVVWSQPVDEIDYLNGMAKVFNKALTK